ncbi:MAG TPA: NfeD family protein [Methylomirabilota bacterium]|nr:NfeD family protein [Methylomirabilota bacterium]
MAIVITLLVVGAILLFLEVFLPGLIAGGLGLACLAAAVILGYVEFGAETGTTILLGVVIGLLFGIACWFRFFPKSRVAGIFISKSALGTSDAAHPEWLHQTGVAHTPLRPSGTAILQGRRVDVVTEGGLIDKGTPVKVVAIEGMRVVVRAIDHSTIHQTDQ